MRKPTEKYVISAHSFSRMEDAIEQINKWFKRGEFRDKDIPKIYVVSERYVPIMEEVKVVKTQVGYKKSAWKSRQ